MIRPISIAQMDEELIGNKMTLNHLHAKRFEKIDSFILMGSQKTPRVPFKVNLYTFVKYKCYHLVWLMGLIYELFCDPLQTSPYSGFR